MPDWSGSGISGCRKPRTIVLAFLGEPAEAVPRQLCAQELVDRLRLRGASVLEHAVA